MTHTPEYRFVETSETPIFDDNPQALTEAHIDQLVEARKELIVHIETVRNSFETETENWNNFRFFVWDLYQVQEATNFLDYSLPCAVDQDEIAGVLAGAKLAVDVLKAKIILQAYEKKDETNAERFEDLRGWVFFTNKQYRETR